MFYQNELKHAKFNGSKFEEDKDRLDDFCVKELCVLPYKELSFVIKIIQLWAIDRQRWREDLISIILHWKQTSPEGVIVKRLVKDHLLANNLKPHTIQITNPMVRAF